jgi:tRNA-specific 2-thiouridylase
MLPQRELARTLFPIGGLTKAEVRVRATALGLRTADKPDSQDVCFISHTGGRTAFLGTRIPFRPAAVVDALDGSPLGSVESLEMVTLGQRRGIGLPGGGPKRYVVGIDHATATVSVGDESLLLCDSLVVHATTWAHLPVEGAVLVQSSAHGATAAATIAHDGDDVLVRWGESQRRVSPGQSVVFYDTTDMLVLGGGIAG